MVLSSQPDSSDVIYLTPGLEGSAFDALLGVPSVIDTGTLSSVTSKSRAAHQRLTVTLTGTAAPRQLVVDTTRNSTAIVDRNVGGNAWLISQPLKSVPIPWLGVDPAEDDTWASGDTFTLETLPQIFVARSTPTISGLQHAYIKNVSIAGPGQTVIENTHVVESIVDDYLTLDPGAAVSNIFNSESTKVVWAHGAVAAFNIPVWKGGILRQTFLSSINMGLEAGVVLSGAGAFANNNQINDVYIDSGAALVLTGACTSNTYPGQASPFVWGTGTLSINAPGSLLVNANSAVPTLLVSHVQMDGLTTGCSIANTTTPTWHCGILIDGPHIDAVVGVVGFGGTAINPAGASIGTLSGPF